MPVPPTIVNVAFPYRFDARGRTFQANQPDHIRDLIEQILFTAPGERVNRPDFGCGLLQLVFAPNSSELTGATQFLVQGALQQSLGDVINLTGVVVAQAESTLTVTVQYTIRDTQQQVVAQFVRGGIIS
jgi:phage baseplate assembly protein W